MLFSKCYQTLKQINMSFPVGAANFYPCCRAEIIG